MQTLVRRRVVSVGLLVVALSVSAAFIALGNWQLDRAEEKRNSFAEFERRGNLSAVDLNRTSTIDAVTLPGYQAVVIGHYLGTTILLDNQMYQGRAGYLVYSVFEIDGRNQRLLINRGWVNAGENRAQTPAFDTSTVNQQLQGRLIQPPAGGLQLKGSGLIEQMSTDIWRVQRIDFNSLGDDAGRVFLPITLRLDTPTSEGFVQDLTPPGIDESRHLGYAFQWFALAATVVIVSVVLMLRNGKTGTS